MRSRTAADVTDSPVLLDPISGSELPDRPVRQRFTVTGVVQGVGFRPFVHRIAAELGLAGFVGNDSGAVFLEVQGERARVSEFVRRLRAEAPPLARIGAVHVLDIPESRRATGRRRVPDRGEPDRRRRCDADPARRRGVRRLRRRVVRPARPPLSAPVRDLHQLRPALHHHPRVAVRPAGHHHVGVRHVRALRRRIPRSGGPPVSRAADRLSGLRPVAVVLVAGRPRRRVRCRAGRRPARAGGGVGAWPSRASAATTWRAPSTTTPRSAGSGPERRAAASPSPCWCVTSGSRAATPTSTTPRPRCSSAPRARSCLLRRRAADDTARSPTPSRPAAPLLGLMLPYSPVHHLLLSPVPGAAEPVPDALVLTSANRSDEPICFTDRGRRGTACRTLRRGARPRPPHPRAVRRLGGARRPGPAGPVNCRSGGRAATRRCRSTWARRGRPCWPSAAS